MLTEVDVTVWKKEIISQDTSVFDEPEYLETISSLYGTKIKYWIVYKKNKAVIGFATHIKNASIVVPDHYSYSSFWFDKRGMADYSFYEHLEKCILLLKKKYKYISFRLPPNVKDVRAFNLHGFNTRVSYTHIKYVHGELNYRNDVKIKFKKSENQNFKFSYDEYYEEVLTQQLDDFSYFGYSKIQTKFYSSYFDVLIKSGFLKSFAIHQNEKLIASALVVVDFKNHKAYNLLMSASKTNYIGEASTFLYHQVFLHLKSLGIILLDLYGADMKGVANYKAGFKGVLENHYTVNLGFIGRYVSPKISKLKKFIKSFI
jgi:hypothetical protein